MRTVTFILLIVFAAPAAAGQLDVRFGESDHRCDRSFSFVAAAQNRALVVRIKVLALPESYASIWDRRVRAAVLETLKGPPPGATTNVLVDDYSPKMSTGEEWLIALSGVGTPFIECIGHFAVKVEGDHAVGRVESPVNDGLVPLDRLRALLREPSSG